MTLEEIETFVASLGKEQFRARLGTKVQLYRNRKGRGRLVIHFYSEEELQAIYEAIVGDSQA